MTNSVKIRAFRAVDDPESCQRFIDGHRRVLENHGIMKVTSSNNEWAQNPAAYVLIVTSPEDENKILGGARIHAADGVHKLPIELATGELDPRIYDIVKEKSLQGTCELCGLWNSREVAGMGVGAFFTTKAGVVVAEQLGLTSIFALCSPYTVRFAEKVGCRVMAGVGNNGTFYYPKLDLVATAVLLEDCNTLDQADPFEKDRILELREKPNQIVVEKAPIRNIEFTIHYDLEIKNINPNEYKLINQQNQ